MVTYFLSDIHLDPHQQDIVQKFLFFLTHDANQADAIYILGDLFEAWLGDDERSKFVQTIKQALYQVTSQNVPIYFIRGNRDFLMGEKFAQETGMTILPEVTVINLYGKPVLLQHGDLLCTEDLQYQLFRKKMTNPLFQKKLLRLPLWLRRLIAAYARRRSKKHLRSVTDEIQDVTQDEVIRYFQQYNTPLMIHGHTHRPALHTVEIEGIIFQRLVLAAWHGRGEVVKVDHDFTITRCPI